MSASFDRFASVTASNKRRGAIEDGLVGDLETVTHGPYDKETFSCLPLDPVQEETAQMAGLDNFAELKQTMVRGGLDIKEGDVLVVEDDNYQIRSVAEWYWRAEGDNTLMLVVEENK